MIFNRLKLFDVYDIIEPNYLNLNNTVLMWNNFIMSNKLFTNAFDQTNLVQLAVLVLRHLFLVFC